MLNITEEQPLVLKDKSRRPDRRTIYAAVVIFVSAIVCLSGLNVYGFLDPGDGFFAECSREMMELGNYLTPHFDYKPFLEKPILMYWSIIACFKMFGLSGWAARLPSALGAILCTAAIFFFTRKQIGTRTAAAAALMLVSFPLFVTIGHLAMIDMMVALFMTVAFLGFFDKLQGGSKLSLVISYASLGLLMLAKGPAPVLFVVVPFLIYLFLRGGKTEDKWYQSWWRYAMQLHPIAGGLLFCAVAAPWYFAENAATQGNFFQEFFVHQNISRAVGPVIQEPWSFYIPYIAGGLLPWWPLSLFGLPLLPAIWKKRHANRPAQQLALMCICWTAFVLIGCSALKAKLAAYVIPAWPPMAILSALTLTFLVRKNQTSKLMSFAFSVIAIITALLLSPMARHFMHGSSAGTKALFFIGASILICAMASFALLVKLGRARLGAQAALVGSALAMAFCVPTALRMFDGQHDRPLHQLLAMVKTDRVARFVREDPDAHMRDEPSSEFFLRGKVPVISSADSLQKYIAEGTGKHLLLVNDDALAQVVQRAPKLALIARRGRLSLFCIDP